MQHISKGCFSFSKGRKQRGAGLGIKVFWDYWRNRTFGRHLMRVVKENEGKNHILESHVENPDHACLLISSVNGPGHGAKLGHQGAEGDREKTRGAEEGGEEGTGGRIEGAHEGTGQRDEETDETEQKESRQRQ